LPFKCDLQRYTAVTKETCLVTIMHANNEVGAVQPVVGLCTLNQVDP
jgi:cysteine sulfinate desulfinase/cysteine desulfurase-like protein